MEINHPFIGHALNAVDAKGRVSVPASFRAQVELRVKVYGVEGDETKGKELTIAPAPGGKSLRAYDVVGQRQLIQEITESVADLPAAERRTALAAAKRTELGNLLPVSFDGAGRMVLPQALRDFVGITDLAFFIGVDDHFEIWGPDQAREALADDPITLGMLAQHMKERAA